MFATFAQLPVTADAGSGYDEKAGLGLGYVLVAGSLLAFVPAIGGIASITTFVVACVLAWRCCCAKGYNMAPRTRKYAQDVLWMYCLSFVLLLILIGIVGSSFNSIAQSSWDDDLTSGASERDQDDDWEHVAEEEARRFWTNFYAEFAAVGVGAVVVMVLMLLSHVGVVVFACLFTFNR